MAFKIMIAFLGYLVASYGEQCTPFGTRLALGKIYSEEKSDETLSVRFNTKDYCSLSYVSVFNKFQTNTVYCQTQQLQFSGFTTYVHKCSIRSVQPGDHFQYMVYGLGAISIPIRAEVTNFESHLLPLDDPKYSTNIVVLGDWGYLQEKRNEYLPLDDAMDYLLKLQQIGHIQQIDLLLVNGDIAYDLNSNSGDNYQKFLKMLSQVSTTWPVIFAAGNHQRRIQNGIKIFDSSFELYNLGDNNITSLDLGTFSLLNYDPYNILYESAEAKSLLVAFIEKLNMLRQKNKPIIVCSHYPLACSQDSSYCSKNYKKLSSFFLEMVKNHVLLYVGGHQHSYERIYPFDGSNFIIRQEQPYQLNDNKQQLIGIVEGIAGNDVLINDKFDPEQSFTAAAANNQTGYGILNVHNTVLQYRHYQARNPVQPVDYFSIAYEGLYKKKWRNVAHLRKQ